MGGSHTKGLGNLNEGETEIIVNVELKFGELGINENVEKLL